MQEMVWAEVVERRLGRIPWVLRVVSRLSKALRKRSAEFNVSSFVGLGDVYSVHCATIASIAGRVPAMYLTSGFLSFFSVLVFRGINKLRGISPRWEFDSHPVCSGPPKPLRETSFLSFLGGIVTASLRYLLSP